MSLSSEQQSTPLVHENEEPPRHRLRLVFKQSPGGAHAQAGQDPLISTPVRLHGAENRAGATTPDREPTVSSRSKAGRKVSTGLSTSASFGGTVRRPDLRRDTVPTRTEKPARTDCYAVRTLQVRLLWLTSGHRKTRTSQPTLVKELLPDSSALLFPTSGKRTGYTKLKRC